MREDREVRAFGDLRAAAEAFEHMPLLSIVTEGPELRTVGYNALVRAATQDRFVLDQPLLESFARELGGQGWPEAYAHPTLTGETFTMKEYRAQLHQPDGSTVELYIDAVFTPRFDEDGRPCGTILVARDVTEQVLARRASEREVQELRERYSAARGGVQAMQRALLAGSVPVLGAFDVAARYLLADEEHAAGGDWFDAAAREDGSVVLVVGDVVGHGASAAVAMGQLRSVLLAHLRAGAGVRESLEFLDGFAAGVPAARHATVCVVVVHDDGEVEYCTAGHPPPLVLTHEESTTRYLPPSGSRSLGAGPTGSTGFTTARTWLGVGEAVVLYSDGIVERPGVDPSAASVQLRSTASDAHRNLLMPVGASSSAAERICTLTLELLTRASGYTDDITLLAAQRRPPVPGIDLELEVGSGAPERVRTALRTWLDGLEVGEDDTVALLHATNELVANVVDHAHLDGPARPFRVTASLDPVSVVRVLVADHGSWKRPVVTGGRGRGLALVRQLVDELRLEQSATGTTASITHTVERPAGLLDRPVPHLPRDPEHFDVWSKDGDTPLVSVLGPLDQAHTAETATYLQLALTEAGAALTVDLTDVTLLASSGVDLLFRTRERARALDVDLQLVAPNGSPAQHVLDLVGLSRHDPSGDSGRH